MARKARTVGFSAAIIGVLVDQAAKAWMLGPFALDEKGRTAVTPFLDLVMVWNRGISYGLFEQGSELGRWALVAVGVGGALLFGWWLWSTRGLLAALSLGLVIAGAISNVIDRLIHGAVADFLLLHAGGFEWYVFNLADAWIVSGVIGLVLSWMLERPEIATEA
jgi:signal peptidase II